jgi:geranylgeranyl diphosphate synthase type II
MDFIKDYTLFLEKEIENIKFPSSPANLYNPLSYFLTLGGKRMRPIATLIAGDLFGVDIQKTKYAALSIELFHNFSLIHDDIMDKAPLRRGKETVHQKWNENIAILSGDVLFVKAYELLSKNDIKYLPPLLACFNRTAVEVCEGQQLDMDFEQRDDVSLDEYLNMIRLKTSVLLGAAFEMGAIIGEASEKNINSIYSFGINLGIAFQIQDDLLDLYGESEKVGKQKGGDILADKKTILTILAKTNANNYQKEEFINIQNETNADLKIKRTLQLFESLNIKENCISIMEDYYSKAKKSLEAIETNNSKDKLIALFKILQKRQY